MAEFTTAKDSLIASMASVSGSSSTGVADDDFEDACSICLEPFSFDDPSTVTTCKHEYHLHCILEWSQRSKECPICWQSLSLKDSASQEFLATVEMERNAWQRHVSTNGPTYSRHYQDSDSECGSPWTNDTDFNERIMHHLAAMMSRARQAHRNYRQTSSKRSPPILIFPSRVSDSTGGSSATSCISSVDVQPALSHSPSFVSFSSDSVPKRETHYHSRSLPSQTSDFTRKPKSSELLALSESIKSRLSSASARYKDSISKGTQGFREKLFAHNNSVKELSKGVQREMNASMAGAARMIERLDLRSKRNPHADIGLSGVGETSNFFSKGKGLLDNIRANSCESQVEIDQGLNSHDQSEATCSIKR